jgi:hypothetical protein
MKELAWLDKPMVTSARRWMLAAMLLAPITTEPDLPLEEIRSR